MEIKKPQINASSMADIAFLLLVFFLVTTTIINDKGIGIVLPPIDEETLNTPRNKRNVLEILVNEKDEVMVEGELLNLQNLKLFTYNFINNFEKNKNYPSSSDKAVVSIQCSRKSNYNTYLTVHNEIKAAYNKMWNEKATNDYNLPYNSLKVEQQKLVRKQFPYVISEAEPED